MKFKHTLLSLFGVFVLSVNAETELQEAPISVVRDFVNLCSEYSVEEGVKKDDLNAYLLDCVNAELQEQDWKKVDKLPEESD
jgi:hypothetical protein